jgi:hypothetical protein
MGYRNPVITFRFDELVEEGDSCHVVIRNPRLMPGAEIKSMAGISDAGDDEATGTTMDRVFEMIAKLVIGWRVYDPTTPLKVNEHTGELINDEETEPRLLPLPATPELVATLPQEIVMKLMDEVTGAINPPKSQEGTTSTTS